MSLVADYGESSSSSNEESESDSETVIKTEEVETKLALPPFKLPTPNFDGKSIIADESETKTSVFVNPFLEAENAKQAILQKHVKMVDAKDVVIINGKRICWNYRKGRCRFGHNCKYAHDSDIQKTQEQLDAEKDVARGQSVVCQSGVTGASFTIPQPSPHDVEKIKEDNLPDQKKRKRPGLTQGLVPGKKVMRQYINNKS